MNTNYSCECMENLSRLHWSEQPDACERCQKMRLLEDSKASWVDISNNLDALEFPYGMDRNKILVGLDSTMERLFDGLEAEIC